MTAPQHIINISGSKDSAACALLAAERGKPFRLVMADTGNENQITLDYANQVAAFVGKPLEVVRADFTARIAAKREIVEMEWPKHGVPADRVERALAILVPTGIPFLDLCIWKGRFPSRKAQFCTEYLKSDAIRQAVIDPALAVGPVVQWLGVRRDESLARRNSPMFKKVRQTGPHDMVLFRPIIHWTAQNVFSYAAARGLPPNPLYLQGMGRVGCFPCINAGKGELREIARRYPEAVERIAEWEEIAAAASKRGAGTFFASDVTPEGAAMGREVKRLAARRVHNARPDLRQPQTPEKVRERDRAIAMAAADISAGMPWPKAQEVFRWAKTDPGGRQFNLLDHAFADDEGLFCSSQYGLCE